MFKALLVLCILLYSGLVVEGLALFVLAWVADSWYEDNKWQKTYKNSLKDWQ